MPAPQRHPDTARARMSKALVLSTLQGLLLVGGWLIVAADRQVVAADRQAFAADDGLPESAISEERWAQLTQPLPPPE